MQNVESNCLKCDRNDNVLPLLPEYLVDVAHGTVSRHGGVSKGPFIGNNISFGVGDDEEKVRANRERIKKRFGISRLISARQVHGDLIHHVHEAAQDSIIEGCDALTTNLENVGLMIGHADCQAVVLHDPVRRVIAAVHSGWRGSVANIVGHTVVALRHEYGCLPQDLVAGVSPSLGPCCSEFVNYREELPHSFWKFLVKENHFDFWQITRSQLQQAGVRGEAIYFAGICTSCSVDYYSYRRAVRRDSGITGRNGTVIAMKAEG